MPSVDPESVVDITGPEGESLFWNAKEWLLRGERISELQKHLDELWVHYRDIKDDRLLALVAALAVENSLDLLVQAFAPDFRQYKEDLDFKFSVKTKVARSLKLVPSRILNCCDLVRQFRNEFAHHLEYQSFSAFDAKHLNRLHPYVQSFNSQKRDPADHTALFRELVGFTLVALRIYTYQIADLRDFIMQPSAREVFKKWVDSR